jgi:hypothetical protein
LIIRASGGASGICEYLEFGQKRDRDFSRDQLDERVVLSGSLKVLDEVLDQFKEDNKTQKYLHLSLSFKEDFVSSEILEKINEDFKEFIFQAYNDNELYYYSEVHLPKIKSYTDRKGELVERKPHIHVVIPEINLVTLKKANPFNYTKQNIQYIDAFQEVTNNKYGLESPKDNLRDLSLSSEQIIDRYNFNELSNSKDVKESIIKAIDENEKINSQSDLINFLNDHGEARVVTQNNLDTHINFKPTGSKKGINLRGEAFTDHAIKGEKNNSSVISRIETAEKDLQHWVDFRALETRFVLPKSPKLKEHFKDLSSSDKKQFLIDQSEKVNDAIESKNIQPTSKAITPPIITQNSPQHLNDIESMDAINALDEIQHIEDIPAVDWSIKIKQIDCRELLDTLENSKLIDKGPFTVALNPNNEQRITNNSGRTFTASDFLTKELNYDWPSTKDILEQQLVLQSNQITTERVFNTQLLVKKTLTTPTKKDIDYVARTSSEERENQNPLLAVRSRYSNGAESGGRPTTSYKNILQRATRNDLERNGTNRNAELHGFYGGRYVTPLDDKKKSATWTTQINEIDARELLKQLSQTHGIKSDDYQLSKNKAGYDRITGFSGKNLSASDFLRKELHLNWNESKEVLSNCLEKQSIQALQRDFSPVKQRELWARFQQSDKSQPYKEILKEARDDKKDAHNVFKHEYDPKNSHLINTAQRNIKQAQKAIKLAEINEHLSEKLNLQKIPLADRYCQFLQEESRTGDTACLAELRRFSPDIPPLEDEKIMITGIASKSIILNSENVGFQITENGIVNYITDDKNIISDTSTEIKIYDRSIESITLALKVAKHKFGDDIEITGATGKDKIAIESIAPNVGIKTVDIHMSGTSSIEIDY